ncbi:hypothetical protein PROFUN_07352 [Planoprotostelium fungivorum]|uniref:mRNA-decapping enzyme-like protein n=1 Tax=Planoprotostelium fungivorum TaxID=1890364 RepID=A0A2P6NLY7_9EUKA|nr:hypothetical protein PROFUN_07352 [Planoprotostelium fungivorum]
MEGEANPKIQLNLPVLQRLDPGIIRVLDTAAHVTVYTYQKQAQSWQKKDMEGALFVVRRNGEPRHRFVVMNRLSTTNMLEDITADVLTEVSDPYLLYRNKTGEVNGIWFYDTTERGRICQLIQQIVSIEKNGHVSPKVAHPSTQQPYAQPQPAIKQEHIQNIQAHQTPSPVAHQTSVPNMMHQPTMVHPSQQTYQQPPAGQDFSQQQHIVDYLRAQQLHQIQQQQVQTLPPNQSTVQQVTPINSNQPPAIQQFFRSLQQQQQQQPQFQSQPVLLNKEQFRMAVIGLLQSDEQFLESVYQDYVARESVAK